MVNAINCASVNPTRLIINLISYIILSNEGRSCEIDPFCPINKYLPLKSQSPLKFLLFFHLKNKSSGGMGILSLGPSVKLWLTSWVINWPKPMLSRERSWRVKSVRRVRVLDSTRAVGRFKWFGSERPSVWEKLRGRKMRNV